MNHDVETVQATMLQVLAVSLAVPVGARCLCGPLPFYVTLIAIEWMKLVIVLVLGLSNVMLILQLLFLLNFE